MVASQQSKGAEFHQLCKMGHISMCYALFDCGMPVIVPTCLPFFLLKSAESTCKLH